MPIILPNGSVYTPQAEIEKANPKLSKELEEQAREQLKKKEPLLYKTYKDVYCLECHRPREVPGSRYCNFHIQVIAKVREAERKAFKTLDKNYAYTEPGWNEGLNAYIKDKWHWKKLSEKLALEEGLISAG